ncbi:MAG: hypothetical protein OEZ39_09315 [Gammaproteobacteria bacterium]|nr:hypothetical protein [Gammaproteobacteria bacterium]MDH5652043.1 hypothetical protein [Gammaproteobacteria bacterium]
MRKWVFILLLTPSLAISDSLENIQHRENFENAMRNIEKMKVMLNETTARFRTNCLKSFGHSKFCECIGSSRPVIINFYNYIAITTKSKEELNYNSLNSDDKKIIDNAISAREKCVAKMNFK